MTREQILKTWIISTLVNIKQYCEESAASNVLTDEKRIAYLDVANMIKQVQQSDALKEGKNES